MSNYIPLFYMHVITYPCPPLHAGVASSSYLGCGWDGEFALIHCVHPLNPGAAGFLLKAEVIDRQAVREWVTLERKKQDT